MAARFANDRCRRHGEVHQIYPGWYSGRAVHIHFKVRPDGSEFTSQLFFDDTLSTQVFGQAPYASRGTEPDTPNSADNIYQDELLLTITMWRGLRCHVSHRIDRSTLGAMVSQQQGERP